MPYLGNESGTFKATCKELALQCSLGDKAMTGMQAFLTFITLLLMALVTGVSFSHLLQRGPKAELPGPKFLAIQQILLRNLWPGDRRP